MPQLMEAGKLAKLIGVIGRQKVRQENMIQTAAIQSIAQSIVHRNSTPAAQLYSILGGSTRRDSLLAYFERFGNLAWSKVDSKVNFFDVAAVLKRDALEWTDDYASQVSAVLWYKAKPEPVVKSVFDVSDAVEKLIASCERAIKKGTAIRDVELFDDVAAVFYRYRAAEAESQLESMAHKGASREQLEVAGGTTEQIKALLAMQAEAEADAAEPEVSPVKLEALAEHFGHGKLQAAG